VYSAHFERRVERGALLAPILSIAVEPHGRFAMVLGGSPKNLRVVDLNAPESAPLPLPLPLLPALAFGASLDITTAKWVAAVRLAGHGRAWDVFHAPAEMPGQSSYLFDPDDDGFVENTLTLDVDQMETVIPSDTLDWSEFPSHWVD